LEALYPRASMGRTVADLSDINRFNSSRAEVFEALGHPVRIKILESLKEGPLGFAELKRRAGLESSGTLQFHLAKLGDLVRAQPDGNYSLTDEETTPPSASELPQEGGLGPNTVQTLC
jgi:hypothetical protein